jgi:membrane carboxypeptidase/penicillin-binding protein
MRPVPYVVESIEREGASIYRHQPASVAITSVDSTAFYQLKSMMQGVLARGTARSIANLAPYVAGKTGTSDNENDAWFVGFTNDVTVAVWLGYDNAAGKRTLGGGATGGGVAVPIFEPVIEAAWAYVKPKTALAPPSLEAKQHLSCKSADRSGTSTECLRTDARGRIIDTQFRLISRANAYAKPDRDNGERKARGANEESSRERSRQSSRESSREARSERAVVERSGNASRSEWGSGARGSLPANHSDYGRPY